MLRRTLLAAGPAMAVPAAMTTPRSLRTALGPSVGDDTDLFNQALAAGGQIVGLPGTTYQISRPLDLMVGRTRLDLSECGITLLPGSNCNMIRNASGGRLTDIAIIGGTWARGGNGGTGNDRHSLFLRHLDRLTVRDLRVTSTGGKYAVAIGDASSVRVSDLDFATASDGVHVTGPAQDFMVRGLTGTTGDDMFAITATDWPDYDDVRGDVTGVTVDGIFPDGSLAAVKIISGTGTKVSGVAISRIYGTTRIRPIAIIDDKTGPTRVDGLSVCDLDVQSADPTQHIIWLRGVASTDMVFERVRVRRPVTAGQLVLIDRTTDIESLTFTDWTLGPAASTTSPVIGVYGTAHIGALRMCRLRWPVAYSKGGVIKTGGSGVIDSAATTDTWAY